MGRDSNLTRVTKMDQSRVAIDTLPVGLVSSSITSDVTSSTEHIALQQA